MDRNDLLSIAQRLREYVGNPHHIDPISQAFKQLIVEASESLSQVAALQSTIAQFEGKLNKAIDLDFQRRETIEHLQARIAELESGRGEPIDALLLSDCIEMANREYGGGYFGTDVVQLYTAPPAPVAMVLPDFDTWYTKNVGVVGTADHKRARKVWNACLDATAALNEGPK